MVDTVAAVRTNGAGGEGWGVCEICDGFAMEKRFCTHILSIWTKISPLYNKRCTSFDLCKVQKIIFRYPKFHNFPLTFPKQIIQANFRKKIHIYIKYNIKVFGRR